MVGVLLLAQESSLPFNNAVLGTAGGCLAFFGWLMYRGMGRAERRVDSAAELVVKAADARAADAYRREQEANERAGEAEGRWENERARAAADQAKYERLLRERDREILSLRADLEAERRGKTPPDPPPRNGPTRH